MITGGDGDLVGVGAGDGVLDLGDDDLEDLEGDEDSDGAPDEVLKPPRNNMCVLWPAIQ